MNRNATIDIAKGIAIFLVVLGHLQQDLYSPAAKLIAGCHMPIFFLLSGLFFFRAYAKYDRAGFIRNKFLTLFVPYVIWSAVAFSANALLLYLGGEAAAIPGEAKEIFLYARSVWFLIVLFFTMLITMAVKHFLREQDFYPGCIAVWLLSILIFGNVKLFSFYKFEWVYPYFILGCLISEKLSVTEALEGWKQKSPAVKAAVPAVLIACYIALILGFCSHELFEEFFVEFRLVPGHMPVYLLFYAAGLIGISGVVALSALCSECPPLSANLSECGRFSLDIYVIHMFFIKALMIVLQRVLPDGAQILHPLVLAVLALLITEAIRILVKYALQYIPLYRFSTGKL